MTTTERSGVEVLNAGLGKWTQIAPTQDLDVDNSAAFSGMEADLKMNLSLALNAENLIILTGLGTSLGIQGVNGRSAPTMGDLWAEIGRLDEFSGIQDSVSPVLLQEKNIEHLLSEVHARLDLDPDHQELAAFLKAAEEIILTSCSFVHTDSDLQTHQLFLRKIGRRSQRLQRTKLFTTNYDLAFETAAARSRFHLIDGFGFGHQSVFDGDAFDLDFVRRPSGDQMVLESNVLHLLKLHGSADWSREGDVIRRVSGAPKNPVLIYPSATKFQLSFQQPYLEMMSRFQINLRHQNLCVIVVGFGFNDAHIVAPLEAAVRSNVSMRLIVADPSIRRDGRNEHFGWLEKLILDGDQRISLINGTFSDLVRILPDAAEFDDRQAHADRFARITKRGEL